MPTVAPRLLIAGLLLPLVAGVVRAGDGEPDGAELARKGAGSVQRLARETVSWRATHRLRGGVSIQVEVLSSPGKRRWIATAVAAGKSEEAFRLTERDGLWYVVEHDHAGKYRPYEVPFQFPNAYAWILRSDLRCVTTPEQATALGTHEGTSDGIATYRTPLGPEESRQIASTLGQIETALKQAPEGSKRAELDRLAGDLRDLLDKGVSTRVELQQGLVVARGAAQFRTEVTDFAWREPVAEGDFDVQDRPWEDRTDDPTQGSRNDLAMIGYAAAWRPGMPSLDTEGCLIDVTTGRYRRIPFQGFGLLPGCFLKDRRKVIVCGMTGEQAGIGLFEIDLKTGANRRLGGEALAAGCTLFPALSEDGTTLAVLHKGAAMPILDNQVFLVSVETGEARAIGKPFDNAMLSWFPDGKSLLLVSREPGEAPQKPQVSTICRMDLQGNLTPIRKGMSPILLKGGSSILYKDQDDSLFYTCDLRGEKATLVADGLKRFAFPSLSPEGERLLITRYPDQKAGAPQPVLLRIGERDGTPITMEPGLWAVPVWR